MAYVVPTAASIKAAFPEFAAVADPVVNMAISEAGLAVDQTWPESAFNLAYSLYAAHLLRSQGQGTSAQAQAISGAPAGLKMRKSGDTVEEFFGSATSGSGAVSGDAWLSTTDFGQRFLGLRKRYFGGPRVLVSPASTVPPCGFGDFPFG